MKTQIDVQSALEILRDFYTECRKEFRKLIAGNEISNLHFICDGFDLRLILKEGGIV